MIQTKVVGLSSEVATASTKAFQNRQQLVKAVANSHLPLREKKKYLNLLNPSTSSAAKQAPFAGSKPSSIMNKVASPSIIAE